MRDTLSSPCTSCPLPPMDKVPDKETLPLHTAFGLQLRSKVGRRTRRYEHSGMYGKKRQRGGQYLRPGLYNRLFGCTMRQLRLDLATSCCRRRCGDWLTGEMALECRKRHYNNCRNLKTYLGNMFLVMSPRDCNLQLLHCGKRVCKQKFLTIWGLSPSVYNVARDMWKNGITHRAHGLLGYLRPNTAQEWVHSALMIILQAEAEVIADSKWHLHDTMRPAELHLAVVMEWKDPKFTKTPIFKGIPTRNMVNAVLRKFFPFVKWFRDGEFGQCGICKEHSDKFKAGFASEEARRAYEMDKQIHSKIHRINRYFLMLMLCDVRATHHV